VTSRWQFLIKSIHSEAAGLDPVNGAPAKACPCFDVASFLIDYKIHDDEDVVNTQNDISPLLIPATYKVKTGDSLWKISCTLGIPIATIKSLNELTNDTIKPGQELIIR
jgi:LysM repeat protein